MAASPSELTRRQTPRSAETASNSRPQLLVSGELTLLSSISTTASTGNGPPSHATGRTRPPASRAWRSSMTKVGDGSTSRTGNLRGEISVRITETLPDGNFRLVGTRSVDINGDRQLIEISGVCRPRDIAADNTILSTFISDAQISYSGTGPMQDSADPGVLTRIVNWLF